MSLSAIEKKPIIDKFQRANGDTGSPEVQIALLTERINLLAKHMKQNKNDEHSRQGLLRMVSCRRKLLDYLKNAKLERYQTLIKELKLRK